MTVFECMNAAGRVLVDAGFGADEARRDASVLARHTLGWSLTEWASRNREDAPAQLEGQLMDLARRRAAREPVAYVTGVREFYGREFRSTKAALIPRPETEGLVEEALKILQHLTAGSGQPVVVDVGTGSGCVAVTIALEYPDARVIATDVSGEALALARANALALGAGQIEFLEMSLLPLDLPRIDMIVSNPPYVPQRHRASLPADVRDFEPSVALFGGGDGLDVTRLLVAAARTVLRPGGWLVMEIGDGQGDAVSDVIGEAGLVLEFVKPDLQDISRVVAARQPPFTA